MADRSDPHHYERHGLRFLAALRDGDADELERLWEAAETDAALSELLLALLDAEPAPGPAARPLPPMPTVVVRHRADRAALAPAATCPQQPAR